MVGNGFTGVPIWSSPPPPLPPCRGQGDTFIMQAADTYMYVPAYLAYVDWGTVITSAFISDSLEYICIIKFKDTLKKKKLYC